MITYNVDGINTQQHTSNSSFMLDTRKQACSLEAPASYKKVSQSQKRGMPPGPTVWTYNFTQ